MTRLIPRASFNPQNCIAMVCAPEVMMRFSITELEKLGVSDDRIFISMERNMKCAACPRSFVSTEFILSEADGFQLSITACFGKKRHVLSPVKEVRRG
jgi:hypothetical protein